MALSSTEAESYAMVEAAKAALYIRSILEELGLPQLHATELFADNCGARQLAMAQQPTQRTRHVDMREFAVLQWTDDELIRFVDVPTRYNITDSLSKPTGRVLFHRHFDQLMGRMKPSFA